MPTAKEIHDKWVKIIKAKLSEDQSRITLLDYEVDELLEDFAILKENELHKNSTALMRKTEIYVDEYIKKKGYPPTYNQVGNAFGITRAAAYLRLKNYRHKMVKNLKREDFEK